MKAAWATAPLGFALAYALLSLLVHFSTWGQVAPWEGELPALTTTLFLETAGHVLFGAAAALPSRRLTVIAMTSLAVVVIDVDHLGQVLGLPLVARSSHSVFFFVLAAATMGMLARTGLFGRRLSPLTAAAVAGAAVLAHMAMDAVAPSSYMPLLAPFSAARFEVPGGVGALLEGAAVALVWAARSRGSEW